MAPAAFSYAEEDALWYLHLSKAQEGAYDAFREHLAGESLLLPGHDDKYTLLRFLKARQWDVTKATAMYSKMVKWRTDQAVDSVYTDFVFNEFDDVLPFYPHFYHKLDKWGRPVYIEAVGKLDCAKMLTKTSEERLVKYHIYTWERFFKQLAPACSDIVGKPIVTATVILDLTGLGINSFSATARKLLALLSHIDQDYYPESLGVMFIINTPFIFKTIWSFVSPMLEERTRKKIHVLGTDYQGHLKKVIDEDCLLQCFGGSSKETAPTHKHCDGPWTDHPAVTCRRWCADEAPELTKQRAASSPVPEGAAGKVQVTAAVPHCLSDARV